MMKRLTCIIHGRVQAVSFRDFVSDTAATLELTGTVQNLAGGTVEVIAEGGKTPCRNYFAYCTPAIRPRTYSQ